jgi:carbon-monoxide dehydrogenase medium subunit
LKAAPFKYVLAQSLEHCLELLGEHGDDARLLAGGQSLMPSLALRLSAPALLIDINRVQDISEPPQITTDVVRLSVLTRHADLITSPLVKASLPLLHRAAPWIAHPGIRHRGTLGGSLALGDPASELPACAVAAGATFILQSKSRGARRVPARTFYQGMFRNACAADEMIVAVEFARMDALQTGFKEVARRKGDYAMVGLAGQAKRSGQRLTNVGLSFFAVGDYPVLAEPICQAIEAADSALQAIAMALDVYERDMQASADLWCSSQAKKYIGRSVLEDVIHDLYQ